MELQQMWDFMNQSSVTECAGLVHKISLNPSSWSYFGITDWGKPRMYRPKTARAQSLSPVTVFLQHKLPLPLDSKDCTPDVTMNGYLQSLLLLSVNNNQFNYYRILWDYINIKSSKFTGFRILQLVLSYGELYSISKSTHF